MTLGLAIWDFNCNVCIFIEVYTFTTPLCNRVLRWDQGWQCVSIFPFRPSHNPSLVPIQFCNCCGRANRYSCSQTHNTQNRASPCTDSDHNQSSSCSWLLRSHLLDLAHASTCSVITDFQVKTHSICSSHKSSILCIFSYSIFPPWFASSFIHFIDTSF